MSQQYTYRDPTLSLWQSAVAQVHRNRKSVQARVAPTAPVTLAVPKPLVETELMSPVHELGPSLASGQAAQPAVISSLPASAAAPAAVGAPGVVDCAKVAAQFLWAEITGDKQKSDLYAAELKYATCDALGWAECLTAYLAFKASCGTLPYRPNQNVAKNLPATAKIAIIGDWGTGDAVAINLLNQIAAFKPDILLHLGDVYYSGTQSEATDNFIAICRQILGSSIPLYSLCGNHDMYSGGDGYYWLIDHIGQQSSYFSLQNDHWQFLAMDTGHNDHDPLTIATNMTSLVNIPGWSEANWHLNKIQQAGNRRIALFSHHQLFSPFASVGNVGSQQYAYNPYLFSNFQSVLSKVDIWFWGHEHTLALYDPYMGLVRGRCVGASAVPVFTDQQQYAPAIGLYTYQNAPLPTWNPSAILASNGTDYNNAFAIMTLNDATATVNYYQVPLLKPASQLPFTDTI
ncbi:MAG TPA: metallophosphoesterase [Edaphobacter sp.]|nr:metallophosphoesterase [Edaphobacter sp.]